MGSKALHFQLSPFISHKDWLSLLRGLTHEGLEQRNMEDRVQLGQAVR